MQYKIKFGPTALYILVGLYIIFSLHPLLNSGYYSDDIGTSIVKGKLEYENISLLSYIIDNLKTSITSIGRFLPVGQIFGSTVMYFSSSIALYKSLVLLLILSNIFLFGYFTYVISKDHYVSILLMLLIPLLFQFRLYHDPILSFGGGLQIILSFLLASLILLLKYLEGGNRKYLFISILFYNVCLYYYELSIPLILLYFATIAHKRNSIKQVISYGSPFIVSVIIVLALNFIVKVFFISPSSSSYGGTSINFDIFRLLYTFSLQLYASLPLSYFFSDPSNILSFNWVQLIRQLETLDILAVIIFIILLFHVLGKLDFTNLPANLFTSIGIILLIIPAMTISLSTKYQLEYDWYGGIGIGYIPVYIQYYGISMIFIGILSIRQSGMARVTITIILSLV
ncbi:hypothetical protein KA005_59370, partial [bacterium]|nr:hypothetical protein [bacterium]